MILNYLLLQNNLIEYSVLDIKLMGLTCSNEQYCLLEHVFLLLLLVTNRSRAPPSWLEIQIQVN